MVVTTLIAFVFVVLGLGIITTGRTGFMSLELLGGRPRFLPAAQLVTVPLKVGRTALLRSLGENAYLPWWGRFVLANRW